MISQCFAPKFTLRHPSVFLLIPNHGPTADSNTITYFITPSFYHYALTPQRSTPNYLVLE